MGWAWQCETPPGSKVVLLAMADEANDDGLCAWPVPAALRLRTGLSASEVRAALAWIEQVGLLRPVYVPRFSDTKCAQLLPSERRPMGGKAR